MVHFLERAIGAVREGRPLPPLPPAKGEPYDVPCDWLSLGSFEDWLEEWLRGVTKEQK